MEEVEIVHHEKPSEVRGSTKKSAPKGFKKFLNTHRTRSILVTGILMIIPAASWAYVAATTLPPKVSTDIHIAKKTVPKPATKTSPLSGELIDATLATRPVTAVVIENHTDARPQSGLSQAGVVYEALAEGGITRFLAFFLDQRPPSIGPVRSVRTYFVDWALEFNAPVAHAGGNVDALDQIGPLGMKDMNGLLGQFGAYFSRSSDREAPHNFYTTSDLLDTLESKLGYDKPASFTPSPRKKDAAAPSPAHSDIKINYSYTGYQVEYQYEATSNSYIRFLAGQPHIDRNTGQQIKVKNVVVQYMPTSYGTTRLGEQTVIMGTPGSGKAIVFLDGNAVEGTWSKGAHAERTKLLDASGAEIPLNPGSTWYSIIPTDKAVSY